MSMIDPPPTGYTWNKCVRCGHCFRINSAYADEVDVCMPCCDVVIDKQQAVWSKNLAEWKRRVLAIIGLTPPAPGSAAPSP